MLARVLLGILFITTSVGNLAGEQIPAQKSLSKLLAGNARWTAGSDCCMKKHVTRRQDLVDEQYPFATILTCSDSRVAPELIFDQRLGDLFVVRVAGNVIDMSSLASLEYGVGYLHTPLLVILGHQNCGAIQAAVKQYPEKGTDNVGKLLDKIYPAVEIATKATQGYKIYETVEIATRAHVRNSRKVLLERSPTIKRLVESGQLKIVLGVYQTDGGHIEWLE